MMRYMLSLAESWSRQVFGDQLWKLNPRIRTLRLLEEVLELAQANGVTPKQAAAVHAQVFSRPVGEPEKELGGVMITLACYCSTARADPEAAFLTEFGRIMDPTVIARVRSRNLGGDKVGIEE